MNFDYPSPNPDKHFSMYWDKYIEGVISRDNFRNEHLDQLAILCQLYVDNDTLTDEINETGMTYVTNGRNGIQIKIKPEVSQRNITRTEIRNYNKALGLIIEKDKTNNGDKNEDEWSKEDDD